MSNVIAWMAGEAERLELAASAEFPKRRGVDDSAERKLTLRGERAHQFPAKEAKTSEGTDELSLSLAKLVEEEVTTKLRLPAKNAGNGAPALEGEARPELSAPTSNVQLQRALEEDRERELRTYRGRTVAMLRR